MALAGTAIGNARWAQAWRGWAEPPVLWCCAVGDPSSGKSSGAAPVISKLLRNAEERMCDGFERIYDGWLVAKKKAEAVQKAWEKAVRKAVEDGETTPPMPGDATPPPEPVRPRLSVGDTTIEKLAALHAGLPKGLLNYRDELAGWFENFGRYSNGGTDRPMFLEAYNGRFYSVDRVRHPIPITISHLSISMFGTIQPDRFAALLRQADDGLTSRFLYAYPAAVRRIKRPDCWLRFETAADAIFRLTKLEMARNQFGRDEPSLTTLADDAIGLLTTFANEMQDRERGATGQFKSALGKARGQALRLALILEYLWWCPTSEIEPASISGEAMGAALTLMREYFLPMAGRVLAAGSIPEDERDGRTLACWIAKTRPGKVNVSAVRDTARLPGLRESKRVAAACRFLVEAGWLIEPDRDGRTGRPRNDFGVNPLLWDTLPWQDADAWEDGVEVLPPRPKITLDFSGFSGFSGKMEI